MHLRTATHSSRAVVDYFPYPYSTAREKTCGPQGSSGTIISNQEDSSLFTVLKVHWANPVLPDNMLSTENVLLRAKRGRATYWFLEYHLLS